MTFQQLLNYLKQNPAWISGFTNGEGYFTASLVKRLDLTWGFSVNPEFKITQLNRDSVLLEAILGFFGNEGKIRYKKDGVADLIMRSLDGLVLAIIPFFDRYPLLGFKQNDYLVWKTIILLLASKAHLGSDLVARDTLVQIALLIISLNTKDNNLNSYKIKRLKLIIEWLKSLKTAPTLAQKQQIYAKLKSIKVLKI